MAKEETIRALTEHERIIEILKSVLDEQQKQVTSVKAIASGVLEYQDTMKWMQDRLTPTEPKRGDPERAILEKQLHDLEREHLNLDGRIDAIRRKLA